MPVSMFDILGPVTVGPSSSHTAGAVRIGLVCRMILGESVRNAKITLYGSFAETYKGHGTDKAVLGGLLGLGTNDERIRDSFRLAEFRGMKFEFETAQDPRLHPNTVRIEAGAGEKQVSIVGVSTGGGLIMITEVNGRKLVARCNLDTMAIFHKDYSGVLAKISYLLSEAEINISNLRLNRLKRQGDVVTVVETDTPVTEETVALLKQVDTVEEIIVLPKI